MDILRVLLIVLLLFAIGVLSTILTFSLIYFHSLKKYRKLNLAKVCDNCGCSFVDYDVSDYVYCPKCGKQLSNVDKEEIEFKPVYKAYCEKCNTEVDCVICPETYDIEFYDELIEEDIEVIFEGKKACCFRCGHEVIVEDIEKYNQEQFEKAYDEELEKPF